MLLALLLGMPLAGLQMTDVKVGKGAIAEDGDVLTVLYHGTLADGKVFDTTQNRAPFGFRLGARQVIPGWDQGMKGMRVGGKRKLVIPPELAYGNANSGEIPPNSTLTFEVELLRVDKKGAKPQIQVRTTRQGEGKPVQKGDVLKLHYRGTFVNGHKFDASYDRKEPFEITVGKTRLIQGFVKGIEGIQQGEKRRVVIPYELAYGENGRPPVIPRMMALVFEIEAVSVKRIGV
jgi:peptidylprolyl isomerase